MDPKIEELLVDWELAIQEGRELPLEELCRDCPELIPDLKRHIQDLESTSWMFDGKNRLTNSKTSSLPDDDEHVSTEEFLTRLQQAEILSEQELDLFKASDLSGETISRQLVEQEKLTEYQRTVLLDPRSGELTLDRYLILDELGAGGSGIVYKALHRSMDRLVALKVLPKHALNSETKVERFKREIKAAAKLNHPNIVTSYDAHSIDGKYFLAMEYTEAVDLAEKVRNDGPLSIEQATEIVGKIAAALQSAHEIGIIHRDIKPSNILLTTNGVPKLLDLGLARVKRDSLGSTELGSDLTQENIPMGTIAYMSPEQAFEPAKAMAKSDVYSLGCTYYFLLTGSPPFQGNPVQILVGHREREIDSLIDSHGLSPALQSVLEKMMKKNPDQRFDSMHDVAIALKEASTNAAPAANSTEQYSVHSSPTSHQSNLKPAPDVREKSKSKIWMGPVLTIGILGLIALLGYLGWSSWWSTEPRSPRDFARWIVNNGGSFSASTEFGDQPFSELSAIPDGEFQIFDIVLPDIDGFSLSNLELVPDLQSLTFSEPIVSAGVLSELPELPKLKNLAFTGGKLFPALESKLKQMRGLETLDLVLTDVGDEELRVLVEHLPNLQELSLMDTLVTSEGLLHLQNLSSLGSLSLSGLDLTGLDPSFLQHLSGLYSLDLSATSISDSSLGNVAKLENLSVLILDDCEISDEGIDHVVPLVELSELHLRNTDVTRKSLEKFAKFTLLTELDISGTNILPEDLELLERLPMLETLYVNDLGIRDKHIKHILKQRDLFELYISSNQITDEGFRKLWELELYTLDVSGNPISKNSLDEYQEIVPLDSEFPFE